MSYDNTYKVIDGIYFRDNDEYVGYIGGPDDLRVVTAGNKFIVSAVDNGTPLLSLDPAGALDLTKPLSFTTESLNVITFKGDQRRPAFIGHQSNSLSMGVNLLGSTGGAPYLNTAHGGRVIVKSDGGTLYELRSKRANSDTENVVMSVTPLGVATFAGSSDSSTFGILNCTNDSTATHCIVSALSPSIPVGAATNLCIGKAASTNNCANVQFRNIENGTTSNRILISIYGQPGLEVDGAGNTYIPGFMRVSALDAGEAVFTNGIKNLVSRPGFSYQLWNATSPTPVPAFSDWLWPVNVVKAQGGGSGELVQQSNVAVFRNSNDTPMLFVCNFCCGLVAGADAVLSARIRVGSTDISYAVSPGGNSGAVITVSGTGRIEVGQDLICEFLVGSIVGRDIDRVYINITTYPLL